MLKKQFALRIDQKLYNIIERWAQDEFRSVNSQIEFLLREAARRSGRLAENETNIINEEDNGASQRQL